WWIRCTMSRGSAKAQPGGRAPCWDLERGQKIATVAILSTPFRTDAEVSPPGLACPGTPRSGEMRLTAESLAEPSEGLGARDGAGTEGGGGVGDDWNTKEKKAALPKVLDQANQRALRAVAQTRKHGLASEQSADGHAVDTARQCLPDPDLEAVREPAGVQFL